ncbi:MAG: hypothetical protein JO193_03895 [Candidatus Eremiobacteraeota bacterium]|nr:hypothetical protein [Candidatus Eremiobacteraeota bacterium]
MPWAGWLKGSLAAAPRAALLGGAALAVILTLVVVAFSLRGGETALFAVPLHPEQLNEVEQRLAEWNEPFVPLNDNVLVRSKQRNTLLLRLAVANVPHSHIESSNEILAKVGALTPQAILDEQKRNGLAADLDLALRGIEGVDDATVIIAPAKPAVYADETSREATASVRLHLHAGARLPSNAVAGIRAFIAAAVPDLLRKNVTIVDDRGIALRDDGVDAQPEALEPAIQSALDQTFGTGASMVRFQTPVGGVSQTRDLRRSLVVLVDQRRALQLEDVGLVASAAAGLDFPRGDRLEVKAVRFGTVVQSRRLLWLGVVGSAVAVAPTAIACVAILIALKIGVRPTLSIVKTVIRSAAITRTQRATATFAPAQVRGVLRGEPPHTAAAIISALPAATAAAVLDLYPPEERAAIVQRMARAHSPLVPDFESLITHA